MDALKSYQVYVLQNPAGRRYIGLSEEVQLRIEQHNAGVSEWTSRHAGPWKLVWLGPAMSLTEARKLENLLKRQKGGAGFYRMTGLQRASGS
jgi:predicted GIY-YIG superfamily endonuclease